MIKEYSKHMICKSEMTMKNGIPIPPAEQIFSRMNLLNLQPTTGMEYGFMFYDKDDKENICHIHFENKRREFEISYGVEEPFRGNGYMKEALLFFINWIFANTAIDHMYALINNNPVSQHILQVCGFAYEEHDTHGDWFVIYKYYHSI